MRGASPTRALEVRKAVAAARAAVAGRVRTTLDLPRPVHRTLRWLAADEDTSLQALVVAAILPTYPDLR
jgi:hypothetical protein